MDTNERDNIMRACTRFLIGHYPQRPAQALTALAEMPEADLKSDHYGEGEIINGFEREVADLLGKEAAVFMPSGTMCQQIMLRLWADRRGVNRVAFHPTCHLEQHEFQGYQLLHDLHARLVGHPNRLMTLDDLKNVSEPLGALLLELPQREIGGLLPTWEELTALTGWAREQGIPLHLDGARLWECQPFYGRPYAEIAALFDSVYVSFYKGLGGLAGSILAGPAEMMAQARIWQRRHGGNLIRLYPYVLSARQGLKTRLGRMAAYHEKALEIAEALSALPQVEIAPNPPHTNMMHLFLRGEREHFRDVSLALSQETGIWLAFTPMPSAIPAYQKLEFWVGDATLDIPTEEIAGLFERLFAEASG